MSQTSPPRGDGASSLDKDGPPFVGTRAEACPPRVLIPHLTELSEYLDVVTDTYVFEGYRVAVNPADRSGAVDVDR